MSSHVLPEQRLRDIERASARGSLALRARLLVEGLYQGRHRTPHRGSSTEFFDYRAYVPGDPSHRIDWRLYGRSDRLYLRRFHQDAQLTVMIVVDASASMAFTSITRDTNLVSKWRRAQELAAAAAFLTVRQGDRVGLLLRGEEDVHHPPGAGFQHLHMLIAAIERARHVPLGRGEAGGLAGAMETTAQAWRGRGLMIGIGDGLEDPASLLGAAARCRATSRAGIGREVVFAQVLSPDELDLPRAGAVFVDPETRATVRSGGHMADRYTEALHAHNDRLRRGFIGFGGRHVLCPTNDDPVTSLRAIAT
ncbi:MAG: DUF58 domain-containing protein [Planctomycetota bacterium]